MNRPNIIVFFTDQQRHDTTGVHGCPLDLTPNFDRVAHEGTHLFHCLTPQPVCAPARACLQSGQYATQVGVWRNGIPLPTHAPTLAKSFRAGGYETGYIGKWHLANGQVKGPVQEEERGGYEYWLASNALEHTSDAYHTTVFDNQGNPVRLPGYRVDALTDAAIRWITQPRERPFFLFFSLLEPHHQNHRDDYPPPLGYRDRYTGRWTPPDLQALGGSSAAHLGGYFGMVKRVDEAFGRLLDALHSFDLLENTIVLFTSDHGCHFKTRNDEYKRSCHEASIRVPGVVCGPGFDGGGRVSQLVSLLDLPPTLLDAASQPIPAEMQGRSLMPLLSRQTEDWPQEVLVQISESQVGRALRTKRWKYAVSAPDKGGGRDAASERYVEEFLYDLDSDPHELTNLAGMDAFSSIADELRARLVTKMVEAGEAAPHIEAAPLRASHQRRP